MFLSEYQSDVFSVLLSLLLECFLVNISLMYLVCYCYLYLMYLVCCYLYCLSEYRVFLSEYQSDVFSVLLSLLLECFLVNISLMYLVC